MAPGVILHELSEIGPGRLVFPWCLLLFYEVLDLGGRILPNRDEIEVLLFDLGGVVIEFSGLSDVRTLMATPLDADAVRQKWLESDNQVNVDGGSAAGLYSHRVAGVPELRRLLLRAGLLIPGGESAP